MIHLPLLLALAAVASGTGTAAAFGTEPRLTPSKALSDAAREITNLPGLDEDMKSAHYSGYIPVSNEADGKRLFYWLVSSERRVTKDPVVLWLTGGPGCSSMDAFVYEHGPFKFSYKEGEDYGGEAEVTLEENPYSWSKAVTMIYVDSPAGAGMSFSSNPEKDYVTNDSITIDDLYTFLQAFFEEFSSLRENDLYIAGESYGGVYVPKLAKKILDMNQHAEQELLSSSEKHTVINLKGYMTGNGVTDDALDGNSQMDYALSMGLIDPPTHAAAKEACGGVYWNATKGKDGPCSKAVKDAYDTFYWVNPYDILSPCYSAAKQSGKESVSRSTLQTESAMSHMRKADRFTHILTHAVPCADRRASLAWLNRGDVREAIHAAPADELDWQPCSDVLHYAVGYVEMVETHVELLKRGLRVLVYSGDHDFVIPYIGTRSWVYGLGMPLKERYSAWMLHEQVGGFVATFEGGLTYATVKGAGHMVPQTNPEQAYVLISRFLKDTL